MHSPKTGGMSVIEMIKAEGYECEVVNNFDRYKANGKPSTAYYGHISAQFINGLPASVFKFTVLRHPAQRLRSLFNYINGLGGQGYQHYLKIGFRPDMSFEEFIAGQPFSNLRNGMTRQLCGAKFLFDVTAPPLDDGDYEAACRALDSFDAICFTERFVDDITGIGDALGWQMKEGVIRTNSTPVQKIRTLTQEQADLIERHNPYDFDLYRRYCN